MQTSEKCFDVARKAQYQLCRQVIGTITYSHQGASEINENKKIK